MSKFKLGNNVLLWDATPNKNNKNYMNITNINLLPSIVSLSFLACAGAQAVNIATYDFTNGLDATSTDTTLTVSTALTTGSGISGTDTAAGLLAINGAQSGTDNTNLTSLNQALGLGITEINFVSFTVGIPAGESVDFTNIDFDYSTVAAFDFAFGVFSSVTGFAAGDQLAGQFANGFNNFTLSGPVDLSGNAALQGLTDTSVEFRFYFAENSTSTTRIHNLDNIALEGNITSIPEPSTFGLIGLAALMGLSRRRS